MIGSPISTAALITGGGPPFLTIYDDLLGGFIRDDLNNNQFVVEG